MPELHIRVRDDLYKQILSYAEKNNLSINEAVTNLINRALTGVETVIDVKNIKGGKVIISKFKTKCSKCGRIIEVGDQIYWIRYEYSDNSSNTIILCLDCYYALSDKTIANLTLRRFKLRKEIKALENYMKETIKELEDLENKKRELEKWRWLDEIRQKVYLIIQYLEKILDPQVLSLKNEVYDIINKIYELKTEIEKNYRRIKEY